MIQQFQNKPVPSLLRTMLVGLITSLVLTLSVLAQDSNAPVKLKPTVVTGSYIPTAETVGPAPVNIISSVDIQRSGQQDVLSLLQKMDPAFSGSANLGQV